MDTPTVVLSISSANFMDTLQPADFSIFKAPCDVHFPYLARSRCGPRYRLTHAGVLSRVQRRVMSAIELCRTAALGGHVEQCDACGHQRIAFNSCIMGSFFLWGEDAPERARGGLRARLTLH